MDLPMWIDREAWEGFIEMRARIKKPLTRRAMRLAIGALYKLHDQGEDANAVLDQSTFRCWAGLFPVKEKRDAESFEERRVRKSEEAIEKVDQYFNGVLQKVVKPAGVKPNNPTTIRRLPRGA